MFCTLGREMPIAFAISPPVLPAMTRLFTWAFVSAVMMARLRRLPPTLLPAETRASPATDRKAYRKA